MKELKLKLVMKMARNAVIEIIDGGIFYTKQVFSIYINDIFYKESNQVVFSVYDLKPSTQYKITIQFESGVSDSIDIITEHEFVTLNVKKFGAKGNGIDNDTLFIQSAIMACPPNSRVLIPKGTYLITSLFLKSNIQIEMEKGAQLLAETNRWNYPIYPGLIESYDEREEYNLGTWEGNPLPMFSGIITGIHVENVIIYGQGSINGNASYENWWHNEKVMNGAFRPRILFLNRCSNIILEGITFHHSPSWVLHPYFSSNLKFCNLVIENPSHSPNTDGLNPESCSNVQILGVKFSLGDDCIAIKSGKIYMGSNYKVSSKQIEIRQCLMENGHGAVTIGSEMAAGVKDLVVKDCLFRNTDRGLRIKTRRGRGKDAIIDNIVFEHIVMEDVMTPFVINCFYFCDPDGKTEYVQSKQYYPVDERTPLIKKLMFHNIICNNCHIAAAYFYGLPEQKIEKIEMKQIQITYAKEAKVGIPAMMTDMKPCSKKGIFASNIEELVLEDIDITGQEGEQYELSNIGSLIN